MNKVPFHARLAVAVACVLPTTMIVACDSDKNAAPASPALAASSIAPSTPPSSVATAPTAAGIKVVHFTIDPASTTAVDMPAPKERIKAVTTAAKGDLTVDPSDLGKTRGQVKIDLTTLATHTFDDATKDHSQTEHAHNWLEAGDLVTPDVKEANRWVIFTIRSVDGIATSDLSRIAAVHANADDTRTVAATVKGDFFLHGHQVAKEVPVEVVFHYASGQADVAPPARIDIHTKNPLRVVLADHDVKPRDSLGKLAQASFSLLGTKVAETADVSFDLHATLAPAP